MDDFRVGDYVDFYDIYKRWRIAVVIEINESSVTILDVETSIQVKKDSQNLCKFRSQTKNIPNVTRPSSPFHRSILDFNQLIVRHKDSLNFATPDEVTQMLRGYILFGVQDLLQSVSTASEIYFQSVDTVLKIINNWMKEVTDKFDLYESANSKHYGHLDNIQCALVCSWVEVMTNLYNLVCGNAQQIIGIFCQIGVLDSLGKLIAIEEKKKQVPLEFFYFIHPDLCNIGYFRNTLVHIIVKRLDTITNDEMKRIDIDQFFSYLFNINNETIPSETLLEKRILTSLSMIKSMLFAVTIKEMQNLHDYIATRPHQEWPRIRELIMDSGIEDLILDANTNAEIIRKADKLLRFVSENRSSEIMMKVVRIRNNFKDQDFTALKTVADEILSHTSVDEIRSILDTICESSDLDIAHLEFIYLCINRVAENIELAFNIIYDTILKVNEDIRPQAQRILLDLIFSNTGYGHFFFRRLAENFSKDLSYFGNVINEVIKTYNNPELTGFLLNLTYSALSNQGPFETDVISALLSIIEYCQSDWDILDLFEKTGRYNQEVFFDFARRVANKQEDFENIIECLCTTLPKPAKNSFSHLTFAFEKLNRDSKYIEKMFEFYFHSTEETLNNELANYLVAYFTMCYDNFTIETYSQIADILVHELSKKLNSKKSYIKICQLLKYMLFPFSTRKASHSVSLIVERPENVPKTLSLEMDPTQPIRHIRLQAMKELKLRDYCVDLFHRDRMVGMSEDFRSIREFFPVEFRVVPSATSFLPLAQPLKQSIQLKQMLLEALKDNESFQDAWDTLKVLFLENDSEKNPKDILQDIGRNVEMNTYQLRIINKQLKTKDKETTSVLLSGEYCEKYKEMASSISRQNMHDILPVKCDELLIKILSEMDIDQALSVIEGFWAESLIQFVLYADKIKAINCINEIYENVQHFGLDWTKIQTIYENILNEVFENKKENENIEKLFKICVSKIDSHIDLNQHRQFLNDCLEKAKNDRHEKYETFWTYFSLCELNQEWPTEDFVNLVNQNEIKDTTFLQPSYSLKGALSILSKRPSSPEFASKVFNHIFGDVESFRTIKECKFINSETFRYAYEVLSQSFNSIPQIEDKLERIFKTTQNFNPRKKWSYFKYMNTKNEEKYAGLKNLANTCYLNSVTQQLFHMKGFRQEVRSKTNPGNDVFTALKELFEQLRLSDRKFINPKKLFGTILDYEGNKLNPIEQMDADEILNMIYHKLDCKDTLGGEFVYTITCEKERHESSRTESFLSIPIDVRHYNNLHTSFSSIFEPEMFEGSNLYSCEGCQGEKVRAEKRTYIKNYPKYLIFTLKRFDYDYEIGERVKISSEFEFPCEYEAGSLSDKFVLKGIILHTGVANSGHYISFVKKKNTWIEFNDSVVSERDWNKLKDTVYGKTSNCAAYILIYARKTIGSKKGMTKCSTKTGMTEGPTKTGDNELSNSVYKKNYHDYLKRILFTYKLTLKLVQAHFEKFSFDFVLDTYFNIVLRVVHKNFEFLKPFYSEIKARCNKAAKRFIDLALDEKVIKTYTLDCPITEIRSIYLKMFQKFPLDGKIDKKNMINLIKISHNGISLKYTQHIHAFMLLIEAIFPNLNDQRAKIEALLHLIDFAVKHCQNMKDTVSRRKVKDASENLSLHALYRVIRNNYELIRIPNNPFSEQNYRLKLISNIKNMSEAKELALIVVSEGYTEEFYDERIHSWIHQELFNRGYDLFIVFYCYINSTNQEEIIRFFCNQSDGNDKSLLELVRAMNFMVRDSDNYRQIILEEERITHFYQVCLALEEKTKNYLIPGVNLDEVLKLKQNIIQNWRKSDQSMKVEQDQKFSDGRSLYLTTPGRSQSTRYEIFEELDGLVLIKRGEASKKWIDREDPRVLSRTPQA